MNTSKGGLAPQIEQRSTTDGIENRGGRPPQEPPPKAEGDSQPDFEAMVRTELAKIQEAMKGRSEPAGNPTKDQAAPAPAFDPQVVVEGFQRVTSAFSELSAEFSRRMADVDEKFVGFEQRMKAPAVVTTPKGCFDEFAERILNNLVVKEYMDQGEMPIGARIGKVPSLLKERDRQLELRATLGATELGDAVAKQYRPGFVEWMHEEYGLSEIIPRVECPGDTYTVVREPEESGHGHVKTTLAAEIDGDPTPVSTCTLTNSAGFEALMWVRVVTATAIYRRRIVSVDHGTHVLTFATNDLNFDAPNGSVVVCEAMGAVAESGTKHEGYGKLAAGDVALKTIPTTIPITQQRLWSKPSLMAWLQTSMMNRWRRQLSFHLIYGTDSTYTLAGLFAATGVQTYTWSAGDLGDNRLDAMMKAELLIPGSTNVAFAFNKNDWRKLQLEKDKNDNYIHNAFGRFEIIDGGPGRRAIPPYPVVIDNNLIDGDALVIAPGKASEIPYNPAAAGFAIGTVDKQFIQNERTALYEEHLNHCILSVQGYVKIALDAAPSA